ncbi:MAG: sigma-E factor negative regulatory protein [Proteobacteria bacterium]|nr:sigma-E factor negative regulatory protein [Pseudomonadota bacterium]
MNDERLSALIDDELPGDETRAALDEVLTEPRARAAWGRYHLIGDALRASAVEPADIAARPYPDNVVAFPAHNAPAPSTGRRASRAGARGEPPPRWDWRRRADAGAATGRRPGLEPRRRRTAHRRRSRRRAPRPCRMRTISQADMCPRSNSSGA